MWGQMMACWGGSNKANYDVSRKITISHGKLQYVNANYDVSRQIIACQALNFDSRQITTCQGKITVCQVIVAPTCRIKLLPRHAIVYPDTP